MKNALIVLFILVKTLVYAQRDSVTFSVLQLKDSLYVLGIKSEGDMDYYTKDFIVNNKAEADSLDKGLIPVRFFIDFNVEQIIKMQREKKKKDKEMRKQLVDAPVPDFDAKDTEGVLHRPSNYLGRVLILHFWNFWDASFQHQIPILNKLYEQYQKDGLQILSFVDLELTKSEQEYLDKKPIAFPLIQHSRNFTSNFIKIPHSIPYLILVDKQSRMRYFYIDNELQDKNSAFYNPSNDKQKEKGFEEKIQSLLKDM